MAHYLQMHIPERYKLVLDPKNLQPEYLFDMIKDNNETTNLIRDKEYSQIVSDLSAKLIEIYQDKQYSVV